jgi:excisionase family DNA binding protein
MTLERHYTVAEAAEVTGLKVPTIRKKIANRELAIVRFGRAVRIPESSIRRLTEENVVPALESRQGGTDATRYALRGSCYPHPRGTTRDADKLKNAWACVTPNPTIRNRTVLETSDILLGASAYCIHGARICSQRRAGQVSGPFACCGRDWSHYRVRRLPHRVRIEILAGKLGGARGHAGERDGDKAYPSGNVP